MCVCLAWNLCLSMTFGDSALFFFFFFLKCCYICNKYIRHLHKKIPATSKEGWPDGKESGCFPDQSGGRGEAPEEYKWGWTAQKANRWGQCQAQVMVQPFIKPYFSSLVHSQERFPGQQGRHFTNQRYSVFHFFRS